MHKNKNKNKNSTQAIRWVKMHAWMCTQDIPPIAYDSLSGILWPKVWACIVYMWAREKHMCPTLLEVKPSIWEALEVLELFCEGLTKVAHYNPKKRKKRGHWILRLVCIPQLINMNCNIYIHLLTIHINTIHITYIYIYTITDQLYPLQLWYELWTFLNLSTVKLH